MGGLGDFSVSLVLGLGLLVSVLGLTISKGIKETLEIGIDNLD